MTAQDSADSQLRKLFQNSLDSHGHGFHAAVAETLRRQALVLSNLTIIGTEVPVTVQGQDTRVDILFGSKGGDFYVAAECKRVDPALSNWCFVKSRPLAMDRYDAAVVADGLYNSQGTPVARVYECGTVHDFAHIGVETRSSKPGDGSPSGRGRDIEGAVTQALRGTNGLINLLNSNVQYLVAGVHAVFVPTVFTTAQLWLSAVDLKEAELLNGHIDLSKGSFSEVDFVVLQYHQSQGLRHDLKIAPSRDGLESYLREQSARSVVIANTKHLGKWVELMNILQMTRR